MTILIDEKVEELRFFEGTLELVQMLSSGHTDHDSFVTKSWWECRIVGYGEGLEQPCAEW